MLYLIGPDGLVNLSLENFQKMVWMTIVHDVFLEICIPSKNKICRFCRFTHKHHLKTCRWKSVVYSQVHNDRYEQWKIRVHTNPLILFYKFASKCVCDISSMAMKGTWLLVDLPNCLQSFFVSYTLNSVTEWPCKWPFPVHSKKFKMSEEERNLILNECPPLIIFPQSWILWILPLSRISFLNENISFESVWLLRAGIFL